MTSILKAQFVDGEVVRPFVRQYHLFVEALSEVYKNFDECEVAVDHSNGHCYHKGKDYGLVYPKKWIGLIESKEKDIEFFFSGFMNEECPDVRNWVFDYGGTRSVIFFSDRGRTIPRNLFDSDFFGLMSRSKFALCPQGHPYKWTYRFYEAALCRSVPVLCEDDLVPEYLDYKFIIHDKVKFEPIDEESRAKIAEYNYGVALDKLFLKEAD